MCQTANGTVFFITDDGYLISNDHVVKDAAVLAPGDDGNLR
jgi:S1-C subfamily serine protease